MENKVNILAVVLIATGSFVMVRSHGVATSSQSMVSGEGWRYGYGIAHGPPGIGHAVGESFPHGYGGFGTYAPSFGYNLVPSVPLPPHPVVVKLPAPTYVLPAPPVRPIVYPKPVHIGRPSHYGGVYYPYEGRRPYYYLDDEGHHQHYHHHEDPFYYHK